MKNIMHIGQKFANAQTIASRRPAPAAGVVVLCSVLLGGMSCAWAGPGEFDGHDGHGIRKDEVRQQIREAQHDARMEHPAAAPANAQRPADPAHPDPQHAIDPRSFEGRAEEQRRALQMQDPNGRHMGRMTADERRDLRRQINEAGQDLYATPPHH